MRYTTKFIQGCISSILASVTFLFLLFIPAYAAEVAPVDAVPIADAPIQAEPLPDESLVSPDADAGASAALTSAPAGSTDTEIGEPGVSITAPTVSTSTGTASFSIPIAVLPGRLGVAPSISLTYSSLGGNGWLGVGWGLDMGSVQCRTKDGLAAYPCTDFIFTKGGSTSDLVYVVDPQLGNHYRAKIEDGSFIRFYKGGSGSNTYWTAYDKNGMVYTYGAVFGTTSGSQLNDTTGYKIFKWALDKVTDTNGNYMTLTYYDKDPVNRELYLKQIDYTGNTATGLAPTNRIIFNLDSGNRPDAPTSYLTRFAVKTIYRLASIQVQAKINGSYSTSRTYTLSYTTSPSTNRSVLSPVVLSGSDNTAMPANTFTWQPGTPGFEQDVALGKRTRGYTSASFAFKMIDVTGDGLADFVYDDDNRDIHVMYSSGSSLTDGIWVHRANSYNSLSGGFKLADANGDGLPDFIYDDGNRDVHVLLNTGSSFLTDTGAIWVHRAKAYNDSSGGFQMADVNGDGLPDFVYDDTNHDVRVLLNTGSGFTADSGAWVHRVTSYNSRSTGFQMADMNGDGLMDFVYAGSDNKIHVMLSTKTALLPDAIWGTQTTNFGVDTNGFRLADVNGDGLPDVIYDDGSSTANNIHVLINTGNGLLADTLWGRRVNDFKANSGGFRMADIDGDGLADFIYDANGSFNVLLNRGNGFPTDSIWGYRLESYDGNSPGFRLADVDGDGLIDIVYDSGTHGSFIRILNRAGQYADLITNVQNGIGGSFTVVYTPSSTPLQHVHETMPFVLQTVLSITASTFDADGQIQSATTNYTYAGGFYDLKDREFRGFGYAKQINPDHSTFETLYHQRDTGPWYWNGTALVNWPTCYGSIADDDDYKGKPCHTELRDPNAVMLAKTDMHWGRGTTPQGTYPVFVRPTGKDVTAYVGGVEVTSNETYDYDSNGNLLSTAVTGIGAEKVVRATQYQNFGTWLWRPVEATVTGVTYNGYTGSGLRRKTKFEYYSNGNLWKKKSYLEEIAESEWPTETMTYTTEGNLATKRDANSNATGNVYYTTYTYDDTKTFVARTDYPTTNSVTHFETATYNYLYGKVACVTDENLNDTCSDYDRFGRPTQGTVYQGLNGNGVMKAKTRTEYKDFEYMNSSKANYIKKSVLETITEGPTENYIDSRVFIDGFGRKIQSITTGEASKSIVTKTYYDNMGRAYHAKGPFFGSGTDFVQTTPANVPWSDTTYNYFGKPTVIQSPYIPNDPAVSHIDYVGLSTTITDPDGNGKTETKDYLGRIKQVIEYYDPTANPPVIYTTNYTYNAAGDLLSVTDHLGNVTNMNYDTLGRKIGMDDPDMGRRDDQSHATYGWEYCYDQNGNLLRQMDAKGQIIIFNYDVLNRVTSKAYYKTDHPTAITTTTLCSTADYYALSGETTVNYQYDNLSIPNGRGRPYSVSNTKATTVYNEYDALGRATSSTKTIQGDPTQYTTTTTYDYSGKPKVMTYPDLYQVTNTYHQGSGLLYSVSGSDSKTYAIITLYEPTGKMGQIDHPANNTHEAYTYDPTTTKLVGIISTGPSSTGPPRLDIINREYTYTRAGNISIITDYKKGNAMGLPGDIFNYEYQYDKLHRFTTETFKDSTGGNVPAPFSPAAYTYNAIGNILSKVVGGNSFAYTYDPIKKHAVNSIRINGGNLYNFIYDLNGNMTNGYDLTNLQNIATRTITYNADNMPTVVNRAGIVTNISYDGTSNRVKKVSPSGTTYYIGEHYEIINNEPVKYIFAGNLRIAKVGAATGQPYFFHKDHLGSSSAMTNYAGVVQEETNYMPFGEMREHAGLTLTNYKFTDQEFDPETGLYYYGARYYDPTMGRFLSPDSVVPDPYDPQTLNRYTSCRNNPIIYTDPNGHFFFIPMLIGAAIGAVMGGTAAAISGGNILQGILLGAVTGAIFGGASGMISSVNTAAQLSAMDAFYCADATVLSGISTAGQAAIYAGAGALSGGINAAISGSNIGQGALVGGIMGGLGSLGSPNFEPFGSSASNEAASIGNRLFNSAVTGAAFGATYAGVTGGNIGQGAAMGAAGWAAGEALNMAVGRTMGSIMSGGNREFINGVAYYYVEGQGPFTIGGAVIGDQERIQNEKYIIDGQIYKTDQHERSHIRIQQTPLSVSYIPVHIISQGISAVVSKLLGYGLDTHRFNIFERWWTDAPSY